MVIYKQKYNKVHMLHNIEEDRTFCKRDIWDLQKTTFYWEFVTCKECLKLKNK